MKVSVNSGCNSQTLNAVFFPTLRRNDVLSEPVLHIFVLQDLHIQYELGCFYNASQVQILSKALERMSLERNGKQGTTTSVSTVRM